MDHFMNPRNAGQMPDPDGHSEVGSPQCGDAMTLDLRINDEDRIEEIRFMTFGCAGAIAAASALTEIVKGMTLEEALAVRNSEIVDFLGGMPAEKYHCSVMGHEALSEAVDDFRRRQNNLKGHLESVLKELPEDLCRAVGNGSISIEHVHPQRVSIRADAGDKEMIASVVEDELRKRTGKEIKVSITG